MDLDDVMMITMYSFGFFFFCLQAVKTAVVTVAVLAKPASSMFSMDHFTCLCLVSNSVVSPQQEVVVVTLLESVEGHVFSIESHINNVDKMNMKFGL